MARQPNEFPCGSWTRAGRRRFPSERRRRHPPVARVFARDAPKLREVHRAKRRASREPERAKESGERSRPFGRAASRCAGWRANQTSFPVAHGRAPEGADSRASEGDDILPSLAFSLATRQSFAKFTERSDARRGSRSERRNQASGRGPLAEPRAGALDGAPTKRVSLWLMDARRKAQIPERAKATVSSRLATRA